MKRLILSMVVVLTAVTMQAARALSVPFMAAQPDGTQVEITLYGDEYMSWQTTSDGILVVEKDKGYYVAAIDSDGRLTATTLLAHQPMMRSSQEQQLCLAQQERRGLFFEKAGKTMQANRRAKVTNNKYFPHKDSPKCLVILANFSDNSFTSADPKAQFEQYFKGETQQDMGHNEQKNLVSVKEYFNQSSLGQFTPEFTLVGPVTLPNTLDYYGKDNSESDKDPKFTEFCQDALAAVDDQVDFREYDNTGDGKVELVCIIYAGYGQSVSGNPSNTIWPKCGERGLQTSDGVTVTFLNCSPELFRVSNGTDINGIGLFCHEFSHGMGLPDLYETNTDARVDNQGPEFWDVMDYGEYSDNGYSCVPYSCWEQYAMGWIEIEELTESKNGIELTSVLKGGKAYKFSNGANSEEWMLIENQRLCDKTNHQLGSYRGHGLLVWHIAYNGSSVGMFDYPNNTAYAPRVCIVPADKLVINGYRFVGKSSDGQYHPTADKPYTQAEYVASLQGDPFPGTSNVTTLEALAEEPFPNYQFYNGEATPIFKLKNITEDITTGVVTFDFDNGTPASIQDVRSKMEEGRGEVYNLHGQRVAQPTKGLYITNGKKFIVR